MLEGAISRFDAVKMMLENKGTAYGRNEGKTGYVISGSACKTVVEAVRETAKLLAIVDDHGHQVTEFYGNYVT